MFSKVGKGANSPRFYKNNPVLVIGFTKTNTIYKDIVYRIMLVSELGKSLKNIRDSPN
jgi:hypothetical protein